MAIEKHRYYRQDDVAGNYDSLRFKSAAGLLTHEKELAALKARFTAREKLLELGCGTGRLLKALNGQGWDVSGMDQSTVMLRAGGLEPGPRVLVGDVRRIPLPDASLDGAYTFRMTNHLPDLRPLFAECARVLRPGGHLVFDTMRWSVLRGDWARWGGRNYPVRDKQTRAWLARAGLRVESVESLFPLGPYLMARLPAPAARWLLRTGGPVPAAWHAVAVWHVRKPR